MQSTGASPQPRLLSHPVLSVLHAYWQSKCGERTMPARSEIAPEDLKPILGCVMLTDVLADGRLRFRLVGTEVERLFGRRMTGEYADDLLIGAYGQNVLALYRRTISDRRPVFSRDVVHTQSGAQMISERVMLPLSNDGAIVNMVITGQTYRFDSKATGMTMIIANKAATKIVHEEVAKAT